MKRVMIILALLCAVVGVGVAQDAGGSGRGTWIEWEDRLEALTPTEPMDYFELAEEIMDGADTAARRELARRLFRIAGVLDPHRLGRSSCLALADLSDAPRERRRLLALAELLGASTRGVVRRADETSREAALAVSEAFSHYRQGDGAKALRSLDAPGAMELLERHSDALRGGAARFLAECEDLQRGSITATANDPETLLQLEIALLASDARTWGSELAVNTGRTLIEVDPTRLDRSFDIDPEAVYFRNGRWVQRP